MSEGGKYTYSSLVMGLNFILFFIGFLFYVVNSPNQDLTGFEFSSNFLIFFMIVVLFISFVSFINQSPLGGVIVGISFSATFWVGFMTDQLVNYVIGQNAIETGFYLIYIIIASLAFTSFGLFFGLLGYTSDQLLVENPVSETYIFRDYWSNVYSLGKSARREFNKLDQKLTRIHPLAKDWWKQQIRRATESRPELMHVNQSKKIEAKDEKKGRWAIGDVYDIASGEKLYEDIISPADLVGVYKPSILNFPETSNSIGGAGRLAFEEIISRFLGWFINSKMLWVPYLMASGLVTYLIYRNYTILFPDQLSDIMDGISALLIASILLFAVIIYLVYIFRNISLEIYKKRPDVRILLFTVYVIILLIFGLYYQVIASASATTQSIQKIVVDGSPDTLLPWTTTITYVGVFTIILTLAYLFIHRESEVSNIYLYDGQQSHDEKTSTTPFKNESDKPFWLNDDGKPLYWVIRYMYFWHYEITLGLPHPDWERVEVWIDAKTGDAKWIVSDYHYRELWYKVEGNLRDKGLYIGILANFHTPIPIVNDSEIETVTSIFNQNKKTLFKILLNGRLNIGEPKRLGLRDRHPPSWIEKYGLKGVAADFCSSLNWFYWRYPWGIDNYSKYLSYPSTVFEEQPES